MLNECRGCSVSWVFGKHHKYRCMARVNPDADLEKGRDSLRGDGAVATQKYKPAFTVEGDSYFQVGDRA